MTDHVNDILFFGDLHGQFSHCLPIVQAYQPKAVILLGDIQATKQLEQLFDQLIKLTEVWWIHGNHDTDTPNFYDNLYRSALADRNLDGRVATIAGRRVAGLGGVFRGTIWDPHASSWKYFSHKEYLQSLPKQKHWRGGIPLRHRSSIFPETYMHLRQLQADVLVTHEAPSCNCYGFLSLDRLAKAMQVKQIFHGHHHDCFDYRPHFKRMGFEVYSVGLHGVSNLKGECLLGGDLDGTTGDRVAYAKALQS